MKKIENILFVIQSHKIADNAFRQASKIFEISSTNITFLVLHQDLPDDLKEFQNAFEKNIKESIQKKIYVHNLPTHAPILFETRAPYFVSIIQHVLKNGYDLIVKEAEDLNVKQKKGLKSLDMSLLRKCPCPVWLCRDFKNMERPNIITAVDPFSDTPEGHDLSIKLLQTGQALANSLGGSNKIISCWDFEYERFLRNSSFAKMESSKVEAFLAQTEKRHRKGIDNLISEAGVCGDNIFCKRGDALDIIPEYTEKQNIDLVVMGTVARTGIQGFMIGNTAENILQKLSCSMFAIKPNGFSSPIKAY